MKKAYTYLLLLSPFISICQISNYDVLNLDHHSKLGIFLKKSADYKYKNADSTLFYTLKAYNTNQQSPSTETDNIQTNIYVSAAYFLHDNLAAAKIHIQKAHQKALIRNEAFYLHQTFTIIGNIKLAEGDSFNAIITYKKALDYAKELNKPILNSIANQNLSLCYAYQQKTALAEQFATLAIKNYHAILKKEDVHRTLFTNILLNNSQYSNTLKEGLSILERTKDSANTHSNYDHLALINFHKGKLLYRFEKHKEAIESFEESLLYARENNYKSKELACILEISNTYLHAGNHKKSEYYLNQFLRKKKNILALQSNLNVNLLASKIFAKSNNYKMAQHYAIKYGKEKDSVLNYNVNNIFAEYGKQFESEQKEKEITLNKLKISKEINTRNLILFGSIISLIIGYLFFKKRYDKERSKKNEAEIALKKELEFTDARSKFLGNISHEIRTPITLIVGYLNLMKDNKNTLSNKKYIERALFNCEKVISDANEVLTLIKFEKHKTQLNSITLPLHNFILNTFFSFEKTASYQDIKLQFKTSIDRHLNLDFDFEKLEKILNNIISNAIKYSYPSTTITLDCSLEKNKLLFSIKDQGIGISVSEQEKIFDRYYQTTSKKSTGGLGIGLSLVEELVRFLNGNIKVKSELKKGSEFTLTFPVKKTYKKVIQNTLIKKTTTLDKTKKEATFSPNDKPLILVVDDNIEMLKYLKELFLPHFNCIVSYSAEEALELTKKHHFDLISSDVMMPNIDGFEFKTLLNKIPGYERIPFIMLSANTFSASKIKGFNLGINDYITKPFESIELITRMKNLLQNSVRLKNSDLEIIEEEIPIPSPTHEEQLIEKTRHIILKNIEDETFNVEHLAKEIGYSQRQLSRILIKNTGLSPVKFILEIKLKEAYKLIQSQKYATISEARFKIGINSASYFTKKFKERFGITPSDLK
ncbi:MAG: hypothetical protein COB98_10435 [Flavobacteriaceae bacterium]|nr:MAG: hypothetical protein COB98_10435 [Flavobacteriaceae bacterium]